MNTCVVLTHLERFGPCPHCENVSFIKRGAQRFSKRTVYKSLCHKPAADEPAFPRVVSSRYIIGIRTNLLVWNICPSPDRLGCIWLGSGYGVCNTTMRSVFWYSDAALHANVVQQEEPIVCHQVADFGA